MGNNSTTNPEYIYYYIDYKESNSPKNIGTEYEDNNTLLYPVLGSLLSDQ